MEKQILVTEEAIDYVVDRMVELNWCPSKEEAQDYIKCDMWMDSICSLFTALGLANPNDDIPLIADEVIENLYERG